ncbi:MAG: hypothetical protein GXX79_22340 [Actinomycetales bacterium]|nr:hypothetical protein [Actinomycetales bacterium]
MGERLKVDVDRVRDVASALASIKNELDGAEALTDSHRGIVGAGTLANRLDEFSSNWRIHRQRLSDDLKTFSAWAKAAADGYTGLDESLTKALTDSAPKDE